MPRQEKAGGSEARTRGGHRHRQGGARGGGELQHNIVITCLIIVPQESCVRCNGKIFEPERFKTKHFSYHKKCFGCASCHRSLESSLAEAVCGPDSEVTSTLYSVLYCTVLCCNVLCTQVYCTKCHKLQFSASTTVLYSDPASIVALDGQGCPRCNGKVRE